jgi:hypothetical protein
MPAGRLRILETASDGSAEFTGEDDIGHTPRGELVTMQLGNAFDLRGERKQTDFQIDKDHRTLSETFAVKLTNGSRRRADGDGARASVPLESMDHHAIVGQVHQARRRYGRFCFGGPRERNASGDLYGAVSVE